MADPKGATAVENMEAKGARAVNAAEEREDNKGAKSSVKMPAADLRDLRIGREEMNQWGGT